MWTWTHHIGLSRSYIDRVFCRPTDKYSIECPLVHIIGYTEHKFVICTVEKDKLLRHGPGYSAMNTLLPAHGAY